MKNRIIIIAFFLVTNSNGQFSGNIKSEKETFNPYFPVNENSILVYETSFGESISKFITIDNIIVSSNEADKFKYKQSLIINDNGVFVTETYQLFKILLFIHKEGLYKYNKPLLRLPLQLTPGKQWTWEGIEYSDSDSSEVKVTGKIFGYETIITKAGIFEAVKTETIIEVSQNSKNIITEWYAKNIGLVKAKIMIGGGGLLGFVRDLLGYSEINFALKEIKTK
jgi:hypothetical protein